MQQWYEIGLDFDSVAIASSTNSRDTLAKGYSMGSVLSPYYATLCETLTLILALPHQTLQRYLRAFASWHGVNTNDHNHNVTYSTRVEQVAKRFKDDKHVGWTLTLKKFIIQTGKRTSKATWWTEVRMDPFFI